MGKAEETGGREGGKGQGQVRRRTAALRARSSYLYSDVPLTFGICSSGCGYFGA